MSSALAGRFLFFFFKNLLFNVIDFTFYIFPNYFYLLEANYFTIL